ncbi:hypothetical protein VCHENC02_1855A, partial [Vibrio harveyi]
MKSLPLSSLIPLNL